jgi:hypothetical protein
MFCSKAHPNATRGDPTEVVVGVFNRDTWRTCLRREESIPRVAPTSGARPFQRSRSPWDRWLDHISASPVLQILREGGRKREFFLAGVLMFQLSCLALAKSLPKLASAAPAVHQNVVHTASADIGVPVHKKIRKSEKRRPF